MKRCTETNRPWPDEYVDVSPDEVDDFLAHAETCAYHAAILSADDEKLRGHFRRARGLSGDGRILRGDELKRVAAERQQSATRWRAAAMRRELPFRRIALYNDGREITSGSRFFDITIYDASHELDPEAGVEIRGVCVYDGREVETKLASYPLVGARHTGEKTYDLGNGYTVSLNVREAGGKTYRVEFRCVDSETLLREQAEKKERLKAAAASASPSPGGHHAASAHRCPATRVPVPRRPSPNQGRLRRHVSSLVIMGVSLCLAIMVAVSLPIDSKSQFGSEAAQVATANYTKAPPPQPPPKSPQRRAKAPNRTNPLASKDASDGATERARQIAKEYKGIDKIATNYSRGAGESSANANSHHGPSPMPVTFRENRPRRVPERPAREGSDPGGFQSSLDRRAPADARRVAFDVGENKALLEPLKLRITSSGRRVWPVAPQRLEPSAQELSKVAFHEVVLDRGVSLFVRIEVGGANVEKNFTGVGDGLAEARTDAVDQAITYVFKKIDELLTRQNAPLLDGGGGGMAHSDVRWRRYSEAPGVSGVDSSPVPSGHAGE